MQSFESLQPQDFNLEGVIYTEDWYLFNRGTGAVAKHHFTLHAQKLDQEFSLIANNYKLPKIKGVRTSFTDAISGRGKIYFWPQPKKQ
jgi:hypothetical protein